MECIFPNIKNAFSNFNKWFSNIKNSFSNIDKWFPNLNKWFSNIRNSFSYINKLFSNIKKSFFNVKKWFVCKQVVVDKHVAIWWPAWISGYHTLISLADNSLLYVGLLPISIDCIQSLLSGIQSRFKMFAQYGLFRKLLYQAITYFYLF